MGVKRTSWVGFGLALALVGLAVGWVGFGLGLLWLGFGFVSLWVPGLDQCLWVTLCVGHPLFLFMSLGFIRVCGSPCQVGIAILSSAKNLKTTNIIVYYILL